MVIYVTCVVSGFWGCEGRDTAEVVFCGGVFSGAFSRYFDISDAERDLGYKPVVPFEKARGAEGKLHNLRHPPARHCKRDGHTRR